MTRHTRIRDLEIAMSKKQSHKLYRLLGEVRTARQADAHPEERMYIVERIAAGLHVSAAAAMEHHDNQHLERLQARDRKEQQRGQAV